MTAPAVVRRWAERPSPPLPAGGSAQRSDRPAGPRSRPIGSAGQVWSGAAASTALRRAVVELSRTIRRGAPLEAVLLTAVAAAAGLAPHLAVRGVAPDVVLVAVVAVALASGQRTGAAFGFAAGLGADVFLATPLGTSALAYTLLGHTLGRLSRPPSPGIAFSLCRPGSTCFACRTGRRHGAEHRPDSGRRRAQRVAARRAAQRRLVVITFAAVVVGRLGMTVVATALGGVPFPGTDALLHIAGSAALSAPLGPLAAMAVRRLVRPAPAPAATAGSAGATAGSARP